MARTPDVVEAARAAAEDTLTVAISLRRTVAGIVARMLRGLATDADVDAVMTRAVRVVDAAGRNLQAIDALTGGE